MPIYVDVSLLFLELICLPSSRFAKCFFTQAQSSSCVWHCWGATLTWSRDSLCIVQDDGTDWITESGRMADTYSKSLFNIAATASDSVRGGLCYHRTPISLLPCRIPSTSPVFPATEHFYVLGSEFTDVSGRNAPLDRRAWCLQEQFLAPRNLICDREQIYWQCASSVCSETSPRGVISAVACNPETSLGSHLWRVLSTVSTP